MFGWLLLLVPLVLSVAGALEDLKTKDVPDAFTHFTILFGLSYRFVWALSGNHTQLTDTLLVTNLLLLFGMMMYYSRQWGGGDVKLLAGYGATIAVPPKEILSFFSPALGPLPFWTSLLVNVFIVGTLYGTAFTLWKLLENNLMGRVISKASGKAWLVLIALGLLYILFYSLELVFLFPYLAALSIFVWFFLEAAREVENSLFFRKVRPDELLLEDWVVEDVVVGKRVLASANSPGVSEEELARVKAHASQIDTIKIKDGIAFGIAFPLALCATLLFGDLTFVAVSLLV